MNVVCLVMTISSLPYFLYFLILTGDFCSARVSKVCFFSSAKHTALMMVDSVSMSQFTYVEPPDFLNCETGCI